MRRIIIVLLMTLSLMACSEPPQAINAFVKGSFAQIANTYANTPHMIVFWSQDCAYCMKEFTFFENALSQSKTVKLITVATDPFLSAEVISKLHQDNNLHDVEQWVFSESVKEKLYYDVSKSWRGELPFMVLVDKNKVITKHLGMIKEVALLEWITQQQAESQPL
ncbi:MAG: thioredoxin-related protein [Methylophagaceae bacterium]|jgi:thioredoxin-related protein